MRARFVITLFVLSAFALIPSESGAARARRKKPPSPDWTVLFRSDDPTLWNKDSGDQSSNSFAIKTEKAPENIRFLKLERIDTGEAVIVRMEKRMLAETDVLDGDLCWSGGAMTRGPEGRKNKLLGISRNSWPAERKGEHLVRRKQNKVDVGYAGWGFSKSVGPEPDQTYSWEGKPIEKTAFEIAVKSTDLSEDEKTLLLKGDASANPPAAPAVVETSPPPPSASESKGPTTKIAKRQTTIRGLYVVR